MTVSVSSAFKFAREVRSELAKVTWPSMKDTRSMTLMVFILVALFAVYLFLVDSVMGTGIRWILEFFG